LKIFKLLFANEVEEQMEVAAEAGNPPGAAAQRWWWS